MPRKENMTVPEGNGPTPQYVIPDEIILEDFRRAVSEMWGEAQGGFEKYGSAFSKRRA